MIALTIKVQNTPKQIINVSNGNVQQEIDVVNVPDQKIVVRESNGSQDIGVENTPVQGVDIEQDIVLVTVYKDAPLYEGAYEVTPKVTEQTLPTTKKLLEKDVKIEKIPYCEVSNNSGGTTVTIG